MKHIFILLTLISILPHISFGNEYVVSSSQTETTKRSSENIVTELTRVTINTVSHQDTITEIWKQSETGLRLSSVKTVSVDTLGNTITIIKENLPNSVYMQIVSEIELLKGPNGSSITTTKILNGNSLVITKRVIVAKNKNGHLVTTEETIGTNGLMVVTKQVVAK